MASRSLQRLYQGNEYDNVVAPFILFLELITSWYEEWPEEK